MRRITAAIAVIGDYDWRFAGGKCRGRSPSGIIGLREFLPEQVFTNSPDVFRHVICNLIGQVLVVIGHYVHRRADIRDVRPRESVRDADERVVLEKLLAASLTEYKADAKAAGELTSTGQARPAKDLDTAELAAWTTVARAILNMNETITRN